MMRDDAECRKFIADRLRDGRTAYLHVDRGLYLRATGKGHASWVRRYERAGRAREMGLGAWDKVTLAQARERSQTAAQQLAAGLDPIAEAKQLRFVGKGTRTFRFCAFELLKELEPGWDNDKYRRDWWSTMERFVLPLIGDKPVSQIDIKDVRAVLQPHWDTHQKIMRDVRGRIEKTLRWAVQHKYRAPGDNPARWRDGLDAFLQISAKRKKRPAAPPPIVNLISLALTRLVHDLGAESLPRPTRKTSQAD
jgi:hypothetical protein